jgi:NAD-dependent oxidoreductase involved in siderophore biosynthesis
MIKTKPKKSLSTLIKEADTQISLYVRLTAAGERGTVKCVSCGASIFWSDADCCHYIDRGHMATRYDLVNLAPGCIDCNRFNLDVHKAEFRKHIIAKYGENAIVKLEVGRHLTTKWMRHELEEMIEQLKERNKELRKKF